MIRSILKRVRRKRLEKTADMLGFRMVKRGYWYSGGVTDRDRYLEEGRFTFDPFTCGLSRKSSGFDRSGLVDGLIPALRRGDSVGLYRVTDRGRYGKSAFYDGLPWDDGWRVDLELVKIVSLRVVMDRLGVVPPEVAAT